MRNNNKGILVMAAVVTGLMLAGCGQNNASGTTSGTNSGAVSDTKPATTTAVTTTGSTSSTTVPAAGGDQGNLNANIVNGGMSVMVDGWIYFANNSEGNTLYKIKTDGSGSALVSEDQPSFLSTYGGYLYYTNTKDSRKIYKLKVDGSERLALGEDAAGNLLPADGWVYYINQADGSSPDNRRVFRLKTDGSGREKLSEEAILSFNLTGDMIYYLSAEDFKLYRMKIDGSAKSKVSDVTPLSFNVLGDYIYYLDATTGGGSLARMKLDGTEGKPLSEEEVTAFNVSGDWIWYSHRPKGGMALELKKMKLDGTAATVVNGDDPTVINVHGDYLVYMGTNPLDGSNRQTILKADGSMREDYPSKSMQAGGDLTPAGLNELVKGSGLAVTIHSAYSTNILENTAPGLESPINDTVTEGRYLFLNLTVANLSGADLDLKQMTGLVPNLESIGSAVTWYLLADVTNEPGKAEAKFHLPVEKYAESLLLKAGETKQVQAYCELPFSKNQVYPVYIGLFDGKLSPQPQAVIRVSPTAEYYVTSQKLATRMMEEKFPGRVIVSLDPLPFKAGSDTAETMYYTFEMRQPGSQESVHYFVKRDTGEIYFGAFDPAYPQYIAVPVKPAG